MVRVIIDLAASEGLAAAEGRDRDRGGAIVTYIFTGERNEWGRYVIPRNVTHLIVHESVTVIPAQLFYYHPNIVEVYCHAGVKTIENRAFACCPRLRRVIMLGVKVVESYAFWLCPSLAYVECPTLERIQDHAFSGCKSLSYINLPSVNIVESEAFGYCYAMTDANFGKHLESIQSGAFLDCRSLIRIIVSLKNGFIAADNIFRKCCNLKRVHLVEKEMLHETIAALLLEEWRNELKGEIDIIDQILPIASAGDQDDPSGEKAIAIRDWIERVLRKVIDYKAQHRQLLIRVAATLEHAALPNDIVMKNVLPFLDLPSHRFAGEEDHEQQEQEDNNSNDGGGDDNIPWFCRNSSLHALQALRRR